MWLPVAFHYADPGHSWIWSHPFILASGFLIALVGYPTGAKAVTVFAAFLVGARCFQLIFDRYPVVALFLAVMFVVIAFFGSLTVSERWARGRYYKEHGVPDVVSLDQFGEVETRIKTRKPFGIFLRSFDLESPAPTAYNVDTGMPTDSRVDYGPFDAIRDLIGYRDTYSFLNPGDPVHANPFPTVFADPDNWVAELDWLMDNASWIVLYYEYSTPGLDQEVRLLEEKYGAKSIAVFGPSVRAKDPVMRRLRSACKWSLYLHVQLSDGMDLTKIEAPLPPMSIDAPPEFGEWFQNRRA